MLKGARSTKHWPPTLGCRRTVIDAYVAGRVVCTARPVYVQLTKSDPRAGTRGGGGVTWILR